MPVAFALSALLAFALLLASAAGTPTPAHAQGEGKKILMYTGTTGYRHGNGQSIDNAAVNTMISALEDLGFEVDYRTCNGANANEGNGDPSIVTNSNLMGCHHPDANPSIFTPENLEQYDVLYFHSISDYWSGAGGSPGQLWNASQRNAIIEFVQNGGGIVANHNATDAGAGQSIWDWWDGGPNSVVGTTMKGHAATDINNVAQVQSVDQHHLANRDLPDEWGLGDEHYNYQRNVRGTHHVVSTLDERTYNPANPMGQDHPISWCKSYDGDNVEDGTGNPKSYDDGRTFVTGIGHFAQNYTQNGGDNNVVKHLVGAIRWAAGEGRKSDCGGTVWSNYTREVLVSNANNAIAIDVAEDGKVYWTEIGSQGPFPNFNSEGYIKMHDPEGEPNNQTTVATIPTRADHGNSEDGVLGMSLEPGFDLSDPDKRDIYVYYSPRNPEWPTAGNEIEVGWNVISRFTLNADGTQVLPNSEREILRVEKAKISGSPFGDNGPGHVGGAGLVFDSEGNLYLGVGDDVSPNAGGHDRLAPMDYRRAERWDARKTSANTGDLRGKVLRIKPLDDIPADAEPGLGSTYDVPDGNMFEPGTPNARPEIYAMGFRQPFTLHTDPENPGVVGVGEYCHDNGSDVAQRSPAGICEWNLLNEPAFHGWPFCMGTNSTAHTTWRWDYQNQTSTGQQYDCSLEEIPADLDWAPEGQSNPGPTHPGRANIPGPAEPATIWKKIGGANQHNQLDFGNLNAGGNQPLAGPIYRWDPDRPQGAFPAYYDGSWLIHNRGSNDGFWKEVTQRSDQPGEMLRMQDWLPANQFGGGAGDQNGLAIGTRFGPDGALYIARYAVGCCRNNTNPGQQTQIVKVEFNVQDVCETDDQAPNTSHTLDGLQRPDEPDNYINGATLTLKATDVGCAGVDRIEWREVGDEEWQEYSGPIEFNDEGEYEIEYRAIDDMDNASEPKTVAFSVEIIEDEDAPTVEAELSGAVDQRGFYVGGAELTLTADDGPLGSGVESIEYRVNGGDWETYDGPVSFNNAGNYTVDYRATDVTQNTSEPETVQFRVINGQGCVSQLGGDEFDGDEIGAQWQRHTRNGGTPTEGPLAPKLENGKLIIPTHEQELDSDATGPVNFLGLDLPSLGEEWEVETQFTVEHTGGWQHVGLMVWQADNNLFRSTITHRNDTGEIYVEQSKDNPTNAEGSRQTSAWPPLVVSPEPQPITIKMRYARAAGSDTVESQYQIVAPQNLANDDWVDFPSITGGLALNTDPRRDSEGSLVGILSAGSHAAGTSSPSPGTVEVDYFRVSGDEMICEEDAPTTTASLDPAEPGPGGTYEGPVKVNLSAADGEEDASGVATTEYRINKNGENGEWQVRENEAGDEPFESSFTVAGSGDYEVEFRSTDHAGNEEELQSVEFSIEAGGCVPMRSDEFDGSSLNTNRWSFRHPTTPENGAGAPSVSDGKLQFPLGSWSLDTDRPGPIAFLGQPLPEDDFELTAQITAPDLASDEGSTGHLFYAQVGFKLFQTDDDWVKVSHTRNADGNAPGTLPTYFEMATEDGGTRVLGDRVNNGNGNLPTWWVRITREGDQLSADVSLTDPDEGANWMPLTFDNGSTTSVNLNSIFDPADGPVYIGPFGGSGTSVAEFEYIRFTPDEEECTSPCVYSDEFDAGAIDTNKWQIVRTPDGYDARQEDGHLVLPVAHGDIHQANTGPISFVGQPIPDGPFEVTTAVTMEHTNQWQHAGIKIWKDDDNYTKLSWTRNSTNRFLEFQTEQNGSRQWHGDNIQDPGNWPNTMYLKLTSDGSTMRGYYSTDGENWTEMNGSRAVWWDDTAYIGLNAQGDEGSNDIEAAFDFFRVEPDDCDGGPGEDDTVAPTTTIQLTPPPNTDGEYEAPVTATLTATDNEGGSGVASTEYRIDGGEWTTYNPLSPPTITEPGEHTIEARSTDNAGNVEDPPASVTFTIAEDDPGSEDTTPPITTASLDPAEPGPGGTYNDSVTVNLSATDPGGDGGGEEPQTHEVIGGGFDWDPAELEINQGDSVRWDWSSGAHDLCIGPTPLPENTPFGECVDGYEFYGSSTIPPGEPGHATEATVQFNEPGEYGYYCSVHYPSMSGTLTVNPSSGGGGDDLGPASGVAKTEYRIDGADWQENENDAGDDPFETSFMVSGEGEHTVEFRSTDEAGNVEDVQSVSFTIDEEGEEPVGEPALAIKANPKKKTVRKKAKKVRFNVRVSNTGDAAATGVRVCAKAPKKKIRILSGNKKGCQQIGQLAAGKKSPKLAFQVKPKKKAVGKKTRIKFIVNAKNGDRQVAVVNLKVRKK